MATGTENFKQQIKKYLDDTAERDYMFAKAYHKEDKTLEKCVDYILEQVKKSGFNGFTDNEVFSMAMHYYDEDDIKTTPFTGGVDIISNNHYEPTEAELQEIKEKAKKQVYEEQIKKIKKKPTVKKEVGAQQMSMF